ncbi:Alpha/Beta hydrolase protein [Podospora australis]|uniref:Alpha/Beta hydrolase protein n=1 Tax=Podospora australis TaxID=1536484 RepID=A0AAN6X0K1_9PEZI|nr:Alpha/Beta hydrolase protein [Podospora australis]
MGSLSNHKLWLSQHITNNTPLIIAGTAIATTAIVSLLNRFLYPTPPKLLRSPLKTVLPKLSEEQLSQLEYQPDIFPGARDVSTPYGSVRVYEFGPPDGQKVLFVHGISTTCMTMTKLASALAYQRGCRVMLFDLFGRGFSDNPADLPHDSRLYLSQALIALASSELSWSSFTLIGYSLGGGIVTHFAASFPHLVSNLILLAPAGLIRPQSFGTVTRFVFQSGYVPPKMLAFFTKRRLQKPIRSSSKRATAALAQAEAALETASSSAKTDAVTASSLLEDEATDSATSEPRTALERRVLKAVHWQLKNHAGFVDAFISCIRYAPMTGQEEAFRKLAERKKGTTAVVLGTWDEIIDPDEYDADVLPLMGGADQVIWEKVPGGHDFPMTYAEETLEVIYRVLGME